MILYKNEKETDSFLTMNNDVYRVITALNNNQELKRLLSYTGVNPLEVEADVSVDLRDKQILRAPVIPFNNDEGSFCTVSLTQGMIDMDTGSSYTLLAIDVFTPSNQWIVNQGLRPLLLCHVINTTIKYNLNQTGGIKYRLKKFTDAQLTDVLMGYRMLFEVVIDE